MFRRKTGVVRTCHIDGLCHLCSESYAAIPGIPHSRTIEKSKRADTEEWKRWHRSSHCYYTHRKPIHLRIWQFAIARFDLTWELRQKTNSLLKELPNETGGPCTSKRLSFRLVAGVWSLAAFIFVQAYTSTLFTYVVTPVNPPLVKSAYDLADKNDVNVLIRKAGIIDTLVSASLQMLLLPTLGFNLTL